MNICLLVKVKPERNGRIWGEYLMSLGLKKAFEYLGHTVRIVDYYERNYLQLAARHDAVILYDWESPLKGIQSGHSTLWWTSGIGNDVDIISFDHVVVASDLEAERLGAGHMMHAVDLDAYPILDHDDAYASEVLYIGGAMVKEPEREKLFLEPLRKFDLAIYGHLWDHTPFKDITRGVLSIDKAPIAYASCKVALNFHTKPQFERGFVTDRIFHALACGCTVVSDDSPSIRAIFGDMIHYSDGGDHLVETVEELLSARKVTKRTINARRKFVADGHTYVDRAKQYLKIWEG